MDQVYLLHCDQYDASKIEASLRPVLATLGVTLPQGVPTFIKPNCAFAQPRYAPASYTHPAVLQALARLLKPNPVVVGENGMVGFPSRLGLTQAGYASLAKSESFTLLPLDEAPVVSVPLTRGQVLKQVQLPRAQQAAQWWVSAPKLKANAFLPFSGALENNLGLLQHETLGKYHDALPALCADLLEVAHPNLVVVDAVEMGEGPSGVITTPRALGALIVGTNPLAVDAVCAAILGLDPGTVPPLRAAVDRGYGPADLSNIQLLGDMTLHELRTRAASRVQPDPRPENHPLPGKIKLVVGKPYSLTGTAGALAEMFAFLDRGGIDLKGARECVIVLGKSDQAQATSDDTAAIIFLGDKAYAPYKGFTRIVRLRGEPVLTAQLLENIPFAMKLRNPVDDFRGELWKAQLQSKLNAWLNRRGS